MKYKVNKISDIMFLKSFVIFLEKRSCKPLDIEVTRQPNIPVLGVNILPVIGAFFRFSYF